MADAPLHLPNSSERTDSDPDDHRSRIPADDVFCQIARGQLPTQLIYRDADLIAFLDNRPVFPGHVLICPIAHVPDFDALPVQLMTPLLSLAQRVGRAQQHVLGAHGNFIAINNRVSQSVPHLHLHVIPRKYKDGLRGFFWPRQRYQDGADVTLAEQLAAALSVSSRTRDQGK